MNMKMILCIVLIMLPLCSCAIQGNPNKSIPSKNSAQDIHEENTVPATEPTIEDESETEAEPATETESKTEAEPATEAEPETVTESVTESTTEPVETEPPETTPATETVQDGSDQWEGAEVEI